MYIYVYIYIYTTWACWDCGFESCRGHGCLSVVSVVCFQVEVSATDWSLVQRSLMDVCLLWVLCVVRQRSLRQSDHSSRGVLWMFVCCECCVLLGRGHCVSLITRPEESYRVCCVWVWSWSAIRWGHDPESGSKRYRKIKILFIWILLKDGYKKPLLHFD